MKQKMIASGRMTYGTRRLVAGDEFEARPGDAKVLAAIGKARVADVAQPKPRKASKREKIAATKG